MPATLVPLREDSAVARPRTFDPALKHYTNAFRHAEPAFLDPLTEQRWRRARREAMEHVLQVIAASQWTNALVLRGSMLLATWFPDRARAPGDLDFVVVPHTQEIDARESIEMLAEIASKVCGTRGLIAFDAAAVRTDDIWTYERVPGRRLVFTWCAPDLPSGTLQLDFVFGEALPEAPARMEIGLLAGGTTTALAASRALSLAWKLLWLASDSYPQGKDLFDAVLLAESDSLKLPRPLLEQVLGIDKWAAKAFDGDRVALPEQIEWEPFVAEYPGIDGTEADWRARLDSALRRAVC